MTTRTEALLLCVECHRVSDRDAKGWCGYMLPELEGEPAEVAIYCPDCADELRADASIERS